MATAQGIDPFLNSDLLTRTPKRHGQSLHRCVPGFPPYDTGAGSHMSYKLTQNARRRTAAHEACNYPAGKHSLILAETSGRKGGPPRKKHTTAPRLCTLSASSHPTVQHGGPGPHFM